MTIIGKLNFDVWMSDIIFDIIGGSLWEPFFAKKIVLVSETS